MTTKHAKNACVAGAPKSYWIGSAGASPSPCAARDISAISLHRNILLFYLAFFGLPLLAGEPATVMLYVALVIASLSISVELLLPLLLCAVLLKNITPSLYGFSPNVILLFTVCSIGILMISGFRLGALRKKIRHYGGMSFLFLFLVFTFLTSFFGRDPEVSVLKLFNLFLLLIPCSLYFSKVRINSEIIGHVFHICTAILLLSLTVSWQGSSYLVTNRTFPLFRGIMNHPQTFGVILAVFASFLFCMRFFLKTRIARGQVTIVLILCLVELLMSQCRTAVLALVFGLGIGVTLLPGQGVKNFMKYLTVFLLLGWILMTMVPQTRLFLLKTQEVDSGEISLDSLYGTRLSRIGGSLENFESSPLLGIGFGVPTVVQEWTYRYATILGVRLLVSVPTEKGNIFSALLEECGILGTLLFAVWLFQFLLRCHEINPPSFLFCPMVVLCLNFGEYSLTSLGGQGLLMWLFLLLGAQTYADDEQSVEGSNPMVLG